MLPSAARDLAKTERAMQRRIGRAIDRLSSEPRGHGAVKLRGSDDIWRVRVGNHRMVYRIHDEVLLILVIAVDHGREIYR